MFLTNIITTTCYLKWCIKRRVTRLGLIKMKITNKINLAI